MTYAQMFALSTPILAAAFLGLAALFLKRWSEKQADAQKAAGAEESHLENVVLAGESRDAVEWLRQKYANDPEGLRVAEWLRQKLSMGSFPPPRGLFAPVTLATTPNEAELAALAAIAEGLGKDKSQIEGDITRDLTQADELIRSVRDRIARAAAG